MRVWHQLLGEGSTHFLCSLFVLFGRSQTCAAAGSDRWLWLLSRLPDLSLQCKGLLPDWKHNIQMNCAKRNFLLQLILLKEKYDYSVNTLTTYKLQFIMQSHLDCPTCGYLTCAQIVECLPVVDGSGVSVIIRLAQANRGKRHKIIERSKKREAVTDVIVNSWRGFNSNGHLLAGFLLLWSSPPSFQSSGSQQQSGAHVSVEREVTVSTRTAPRCHSSPVFKQE